MKYIIVFRCTRSGAECTCEVFPFDGRSAEQSMVSCINYHVSAGYSLVSISTAPLVGDELPDEEAYEDDETAVHDFVLDDFNDMALSYEPQPLTADEIAPYFHEFLKACRIDRRTVPDGLTVESYVSTWNDLCSARTRS